MTIRIADFFCGIGGIRLGFQQANCQIKCVLSNDIDEKASITYETNFGDKVNQISISELKIEDIPDFDIFLGGFPCQAFSIAGQRKGFDDERGQLFFDIVRILQAKQPKAFLLENVKNLKNHNNGETWKIIKYHLIKAGYFFKSKILNTKDYANCPQNRERIFLVGFLNRKQAEQFTFPRRVKNTRKIIDFLDNNIPNKYYYTEDSAIYTKLIDNVKYSIDDEQIYQYRRYHVRANASKCCPTLTANMGY